MRAQIILLAAGLGVVPMLCAQQASAPVITIKAIAKGEIPSGPGFTTTAMCDDAGNVYSQPFDPLKGWGADRAPVQEITGAAKPAGRFPVEGNTFFVRHDRVYSLAGSKNVSYVVEFVQDGSVRAQTKLQLDFFVQVFHLAVFKSGEYLVVGLIGTITETAPHLRTPFTAVFAADGQLVKKIYEPEDEDARQRAEGSDPKYFRCCSDSGNEFVAWNADVAAGSDGNVYLMHGNSPPLIYVISPAGDVVRKFPIDPSDPERVTNSIKFHDGRLAIGFNWLGDLPESLIKVIDLRGNSIADYRVKEGAKDSNPILACYTSDGFTLMPRLAGAKPYLLTAKLP
jgi:hypothetical protein